MERQLIFEEHAHESGHHLCVLLTWTGDAVMFQSPGEPWKPDGENAGFPASETHAAWNSGILSHEEALELEGLLLLTRIPLAVPDRCLLDGMDYSLRIRAGGQELHLVWQGFEPPLHWGPLDRMVRFLQGLHCRHARPS